ncbi:MAG: hypothetical protein FRX49_00887 [Trebouxia sp. A1-2]|nr:MAG: hypothetical protein FRX49_00887 [Trebouxia sp. A1-2]
MAQSRTGLSDCTAAVQRQPDTRHVLSREQAIQVYDRRVKCAGQSGATIKDSSSVYGGPATKALLQAADLKSANFVFEFGSGSGGLADLLLSTVLHAECQYHAVDQSPVQVELTQQRLNKHGDRAHAQQISGDLTQAATNILDGAVDVFLSTYVLDILSDQDIDAVLCLAHRLVRPGGLVCLVGLTYGDTPLSKLASGVWGLIHALRPHIVGGCRPQNLVPYLSSDWIITKAQVVPGGMMRSQLIIAHKTR